MADEDGPRLAAMLLPAAPELRGTLDVDTHERAETTAASLEPTSTAFGPEASSHALRGRVGAASALALGDDERVLELVAAMDLSSIERGSELWFSLGAIRGRALRRLGRHAQAVHELSSRWSAPGLARWFPRDALGLELARAKLGWAETLPPAQADQQRQQAIDVLGRIRKDAEIRNAAEVRVLQADALLAVGMERRGNVRTVAARKAAAATAQILEDYPGHPRSGELWLAHALALERSGRARDAADTLRRIHIERAGEPEAARAWDELTRLAGEHRLRVSPLAATEELERAAYARSRRFVDLSREILDRLEADTRLPAHLRAQARSSRAFTASKQRDFVRCADDLRPTYARTGNFGVRDELLRCLERGELYDEALAILRADTQSKRKNTRLTAQWDALALAVRAGRYQEGLDLLIEYEKGARGHGQTRAWLHAWLPMRLGQVDEAIAGFEQAERNRSDRTRARYFRGKLLLTQPHAEAKTLGASLLREVITRDPFDYYGLQARQRMLDAGLTPPPLPVITPMRGEDVRPTRLETEATLADLDREFGEAWPSIRRARQFHAAGYLEEARRELRIAAQAFLTGGKSSPGPRNEDFYVGLGWKPEWALPRIAPTKAARKQLRDAALRERLRVGLREVARGLDEPYRTIRLSDNADGHWRARWQPRAYRWAVEREARLRGIDPIHMWSLMYTESRFRRFVVSSVGARGALQIMPWTARQLAERLGELRNGTFDNDTLFDIDVNAHLSGAYVAELLAKFHGQAPMAYASYNGGPSNVARWLTAKAKSPAPLEMDVFIEEIAFDESYRYTKRVMEVAALYGLLYAGGLPRWSNRVDPVSEDNIDF